MGENSFFPIHFHNVESPVSGKKVKCKNSRNRQNIKKNDNSFKITRKSEFLHFLFLIGFEKMLKVPII